MTKKNVLVSIVALASILFSPLGWCPPPPNFGVFLPSGDTFDFGAVPVGTSRSIAISYVVAPGSAALAPFVIATNFSAYIGIYAASYSIDPGRTTCVPGALVTTTSGCTVVVTFTPTISGQRDVATVLVSAAPVSDPTSVSSVTFNNLTAVGSPSVQVVPTLSNWTLFALAVLIFMVASVAFTLSRRERRSRL